VVYDYKAGGHALIITTPRKSDRLLDTAVHYSNAMASQLLGLTRDEMHGKRATDPVWRFIQEDGTRLPVDKYPVNRALQTAGERKRDLIVGICRPDREGPTWVQFDTQVIQNPGSQLIVVTFFEVTVQMRAATTLKASEMRYRRLFESAQDGILILDAEMGTVVDVNPFLTELLGYSRELFVGRKIWELGFLKDSIANKTHFTELQEKEYIRYDDLPLETADGRRIAVEFVSNVYLVNGHKVIQCNIRDISAKKRVEEALWDSGEQFRAMFEVASIGMAQADVQTGQWLRVNHKMCAITGYSADEMLKMRILDITHPDDRKKDWEEFQRVVKGEAADYRLEKRYIRKDGSVVWVNVNMTIIRDVAGQPVRTIAAVEDITERKASEQQIRQLSRAVEQSPISIILTNTKGDIHYVNPKFTEVTGYSLEEVVSRNPRLLKSGHQSPGFYKKLWETITAGHDWRGELGNRKKNGEIYWESALISPIKDEHGTITHFMALKEDITERKRAEQDVLEISGHELNRIGQELHDDICQWMAATSMLAGALARNLAKESPENAARAREVSENTRHALDSLRMLARGLTPEVIQLEGGLTGALLKLAANVENMFRIRCLYECAGTVEIRDENVALHLYRIAQEAISNAVRHGGAQEVVIVLRRHDGRVSMLIRDDGSGIPQPLPLTSGMGLRSMRYRAESIGATLEIRPGASGGTEIVCTLPEKP